jgi:hypothetical protein
MRTRHNLKQAQKWKEFASSRRRSSEANGKLSPDQANSPGFGGQVSNVLTTSKTAVVITTTTAAAPVVSGFSAFSLPVHQGQNLDFETTTFVVSSILHS